MHAYSAPTFSHTLNSCSHTSKVSATHMEFRFNFLQDINSDPLAVKKEDTKDKESISNTAVSYQEHYPNLEELSVFSTKPQSIQLNSLNKNIYYTKLDDIKKTKGQDLILFTDNAHSDLVSGVYEGGLKIWECTYDLLDHMTQVDFEGKTVLDLGCGSGLLGIFALMSGAKEVHFQDFNPEVIQDYTIPNVLLNTNNYLITTTPIQGNDDIWNKCRFFSGHWENFRPTYTSDSTTQLMKYDVILTSETIYNSSNHFHLLNVFYQLLDIRGRVFLAAKTHYFGVGGNLSEFIGRLQGDKLLSCVTVKTIPDCVQRAILELKML